MTPSVARRLALPKLGIVTRSRSRRQRSFLAVGSFVILFLVLNFGFTALLDYGPRRLRDPEYGKRLSRLQARVAEHPNRPLVAIVGSSRTAMGVRPDVLDADTPLLFNMSLVGSGPIMELLTVRRMLADGVKPEIVLLEYWPAFLREDPPYSEEGRFLIPRLYPVDRPTIREYFSNPEQTEEQMRRLRLAPWYSQRMSLMNQLAGSWLPYYQRTDGSFEKIDDWGWLPGREISTPAMIEIGHKASGDFYIPLFRDYRVSPDADRAMRQTVAELRAAGVTVGLVYLPESARFRGFMPPEAVTIADDHLAKLQADLDLPLIDCRGWVSDDHLPDGFHLTRPGAAEFTQKLAPAITATFPELEGTR